MKSTHVRNHTSHIIIRPIRIYNTLKHSSEQVEKIIESHGQNKPARRILELRHHHRASIWKFLFLLRNLFKLMECLLHYTFFSYLLFTLGRDVMHRTSSSAVVCRKRRGRNLLTHSMTLSKKDANSAQRLSTRELIIGNLPESIRMPNSIRLLKSISMVRLAFIVCRTFANANKFTLTAVKCTISREIFFLRVFYHSTAKIIHLIHFTNFSAAGRTFSFFFCRLTEFHVLLDNFTAEKKNSKCGWQRKKSQKHKFSWFPASARPVIKFNLSRVNDENDDVVLGASVMSWFLDILIQFSQECRRHDANDSVIQSELVSREVSTFSFTSEKLLHNKNEDFVASKYRNRNRWRRLYICNFLRDDKIMRAVISRWNLNLFCCRTYFFTKHSAAHSTALSRVLATQRNALLVVVFTHEKSRLKWFTRRNVVSTHRRTCWTRNVGWK